MKEGSPAAGFLQDNDILLAINGNEINDVLDYMYHGAGEQLELQVRRGEKLLQFFIEKEC